MGKKIIDGHVHFHFGTDVPKEDMKTPIKDMASLLGHYNVKHACGIFLPDSIELSDEISGMDVFRGIYIQLPDDLSGVKKCNETADFVKIRGWLSSPDASLEQTNKVILSGIDAGFTRFQIHTENLTEEFLKMLKKHVKNNEEIIFYLAHGTDALLGNMAFSSYEPSEMLIEEINQLGGNLLLGTSTSSSLYQLPNEKIEKLVELGLEERIAYESDFTLNLLKFNPKFYETCLKNALVLGTYNRKIMEENCKKFMER